MKGMLNKVVALSMLLAIGGQVVAGCKNGQCAVRRQPVRVAKNVKRVVRKQVAKKAPVKQAPKKAVNVAPKAATVKAVVASAVKQAPVNTSKFARFASSIKTSGSKAVSSVKNGANSAWNFVSTHAKKLIASAAVLGGSAAYVIKNEKANTAVKGFLNTVKAKAGDLGSYLKDKSHVAAGFIADQASKIGYENAGLGFAAVAATYGAYRAYNAYTAPKASTSVAKPAARPVAKVVSKTTAARKSVRS